MQYRAHSSKRIFLNINEGQTFTSISLAACCLDADWMDEDRFACCGGDGNAYLLQPVKQRDDEKVPIHLGKIRDPMTMRTLKSVLFLLRVFIVSLTKN